MKLIYICSPYRGNTAANAKAAQKYCRQVIEQGDIPVAPHLYFPQFVNDNDLKEREQALKIGLRLINYCSEVWVYGEKISEGMKMEIAHAEYIGKPIAYKPALKTRRNFTPPTLEEVQEYVSTRGNKIDAKQFYDFFNTPNNKGETWIDSRGQPVRNWKQKVITWETGSGTRKESHFMNYNQRRYSEEELKTIGLNLLEDI